MTTRVGAMWSTWTDGAWPTGLHRLSAPSLSPGRLALHTNHLAAVVRHGAERTRQRIEVSTMAYAKITRQWPDESAIVLEVGCREAYPDAIAQCVAEVARLEGLVVPDDAELPDE